MRLRPISVIYGFLVLLIALSCHSQIEANRRPFAPLSEARVSLSNSQITLFIDKLKEFAASEHLEFAEGNFTKQGRPVVNVAVRLNAETFYQVDNFRDPTKFEINAYSHASDDVWQPIWERLMTKLKSQFGVEIVK